MTVNEEFERDPAKLIAALDRTRRHALQRAERFAAVRGAAQAREVARVAAAHPDGSPEVVERSAALLGHAVVVENLRDELEAGDLVRSVKPGTAFAVGRVVGAAGRRPPGLKVVVTTNKNVEVAGAGVERSGAFVIKPLGREQQALVAQSAGLVFTLADKAGKEIHRASVESPGATGRMLVVTIDVGPVIGTRFGPGILRPDIIPKLGEDRVARLREAGIRDVAGLAGATGAEISRLLDISSREAGGIVRRAKKLAEEDG
jgi:hypothetical protein